MSPKTRDISEQEAKEFLQIIEDSSNYQFGFNHSTGYSMVGYTCAMLRYYYPEEFVAAYLNNANNEDDIRSGTELARIKGISINPIKFRHSGAKYTVDKKHHALYKGCESVKFLNMDVSEKLYAMKDQCFKSFLNLLDVFPGNSRMMDILVKLGYFEEFGKSAKLLKICELYDTYKGKKILKKDKLDLPLELVQKYAESETAKQYRFSPESMDTMLQELVTQVPDADIPLKDRLAAELEYLGYISYIDPKLKDTGLVLSVDTKYSPKITVYMLSTGVTETYKLGKVAYTQNPFDAGAVIRFYAEERPKSKKVDGQWVKTDEKEKWITNYILKTDL